ncbi:A-factor biosynthesis enzyme, partial [Streptomyces zinciresistens K42]
QLRVDTSHAVFFDHPLDHVPGMLLLEAACQAVRARPENGAHTPVSFHTVFHRYAELHLPLWIEAARGADGPGGGVRITGVQGESAVFECGVGTRER